MPGVLIKDTSELQLIEENYIQNVYILVHSYKVTPSGLKKSGLIRRMASLEGSV
jgi:hypothetical protein